MSYLYTRTTFPIHLKIRSRCVWMYYMYHICINIWLVCLFYGTNVYLFYRRLPKLLPRITNPPSKIPTIQVKTHFRFFSCHIKNESGLILTDETLLDDRFGSMVYGSGLSYYLPDNNDILLSAKNRKCVSETRYKYM